MSPSKKYPTLGCCGIDCALCPRYNTDSASRCPGCCGPDFQSKHPSCSFVTCCVKKRNLEVCAECPDYPCAKFDKETGEADSFVTHRRVRCNQECIKEQGLDSFIDQQGKRITVLKTLLSEFNDGKSKSFYCLAATLLSQARLDKAILLARSEIKQTRVDASDAKSKALIIKKYLNQFALEDKEELALRNKK